MASYVAWPLRVCSGLALIWCLVACETCVAQSTTQKPSASRQADSDPRDRFDLEAPADAPAPPPLPATPGTLGSPGSDSGLSLKQRTQQLIKDLDSPNFRVRLTASRNLSRVAAGAVDALRRAATHGSLEVRARVIDILKTMYISSRKRDATAADEVLEGLVETGDAEAAMAAKVVLLEHSDLRDQRAWQHIERLGGRRRNLDQQRVIVPNGAVFRMQRAVANIELDDQWTGGDGGLKYLKRLSSIDALYLIDGVNVSQDAVDELFRVIPGLNVQRRGSAYLGIAGAPNPLGGLGCLVASVKVNSAAFQAKIERGDVITKFNGVEIPSFEALIAQIKTKKAGDVVRVNVSRQGQPLELDVTLGRWSDK
ncbi:MAG: PDZ domain-containing protein [Planctomycetaceae bacterium]